MKKVEVFNESGQDIGWIGKNQKWWFDEDHPNSFELFDIDTFYEKNYFKSDHVSYIVTKKYVNHVINYYKKITNKNLNSVLEAGCGGGWFTKEFLNRNIDIFALEGSICGYDSSISKGISTEIIKRHDLRLPINLEKRFDMVCCTEVAEHIETPFSATLIKTLVDHSDIIWFSFEPPGTNSAHYHHCNEQPEKFWVNIFDFYDYGYIKVPQNVIADCEYRASHIFYNRKKITI